MVRGRFEISLKDDICMPIYANISCYSEPHDESKQLEKSILPILAVLSIKMINDGGWRVPSLASVLSIRPNESENRRIYTTFQVPRNQSVASVFAPK
jgi:hypothetical protein